MAASDIARTPVVVQRGRDEPQWQGVPLGSDTLFLLTANGPPIRPPQWRWDYDPPPVWLADPVPTNIRTFPVVTPVVNLWQQWTYDVAPPWQGVPEAANYLLLGGQVKTAQWRWDQTPDPVWTWRPPPNEPLYQPAGKPFGKQWRADFDVDTRSWQWEPANVTIGLPVPSLQGAGAIFAQDADPDTRLWQWRAPPVTSIPAAAKPFSRQWRWDLTPDPAWTWPPQPTDTLYLLTAGGKPFSRQWRWDHVPDPVWYAAPQSTNIGTFPVSVKPFSRLSRFDYAVDQQPLWLGVPVASPFELPSAALTGPTQAPFYVPRGDPSPSWQGEPQPSNIGTFPVTAAPFSKLWRWDHVPEPPWVGISLPGDPLRLLTAGGKPFARQWRYDHTPEPAWVWEAPPDWSLVLPTTVPFFRLWRWDHQPEPSWTGKPQASSTLPAFTAGGEPFARFWRYDYVPDPVWPGEPQPTNIGTLPAPIVTGPAQSPFYVPRGDPPPPWQGEPQPSNIGTFPVSVKPFGKWWAWNHVPDPVWLGEPQAANIGTLPTAGTPFSRLWRWDYVPDPAWIWTAPASDPLRLLTAGGEPFSRQWRYDYVPDALWLGEPVAVPIETFPAAATPFSRLWRYDLTPSPDWTWQPAASGAMRALTAGGAPTFRQWRYDYDSGATFWQGVPLVTNITTLVQTAPFHQQWRYDWDSGRSWWQGAPIGVNVPIANPGPPVPVVPPTTGAGGELPPGYRWRWTDFNDRAWLKAFRDEFYRLRRLKNPERRRRQFEVLEQKFIGAAERALEYETPYEKKLDLVQLGEMLQGFATPASFDRIEMYLVALAAEIDDEEAFLLLND